MQLSNQQAAEWARDIRENERRLVVDAFKTFGADVALVAKVEAFFERLTAATEATGGDFT